MKYVEDRLREDGERKSSDVREDPTNDCEFVTVNAKSIGFRPAFAAD